MVVCPPVGAAGLAISPCGADSGLMITNNFAQREVSTAAYDEQQIHLRPIVVDLDHGVLPMNLNEKKKDKKI
jgi:hypothetical protein